MCLGALAVDVKLNLGCGTDIRDGWVNMDSLPLAGVDIVHDATVAPWPLKDVSFDLIEARHFMEHIPHGSPGVRDHFLVVMEEVHRVLKPGGKLVVVCPHPDDAEGVWGDPTHTRLVNERTWRHFSAVDTGIPRFYSPARFHLRSSQVTRRRLRAFPATFMRIGASKLGILDHASLRLAFLRRRLSRPEEAEYVLERA